MRVVRPAVSSDLAPLLELYLHVNPNRPPLSDERATKIFAQILTRPDIHLFVCEADGVLAASCMLAVVPNLMRGGRSYGLIENVVTHADYRRRGHGKAVIQTALAAAWEADAYVAYLMTGRPDPGVRLFYESCGFELGVKAGYVARSPD